MVTWFSRRIPVMLQDGLTRHVSSLDEARELLVDPLWPKKKGARYDRAIRAVWEMEGDLDAAENAFEAAAKDAKVLLKRT